MTQAKLKIGSVVAYRISEDSEWVESIIYKVSDSYVWFKGNGYSRINMKTFENWPMLYKIVSI